MLLGGCGSQIEVLAPPWFALGSAVCKAGLLQLLALHHSPCPRGFDGQPGSPRSGRLSPSPNLPVLCNIKVFYEIDFFFSFSFGRFVAVWGTPCSPVARGGATLFRSLLGLEK